MVVAMMNASDHSPAAPTILRLPDLASSSAIARACRDAWTSFVDNAHEWGKSELILWTFASYSQTTRYASETASERFGPPALDDFRNVDARFVERLLRAARQKVIDTLSSFTSLQARVDFAYSMLSTGHVIRCEDDAGNVGFVPIAEAGPLAVRVLAFIAADLLTNAYDFEQPVLCADNNHVCIGRAPCCGGENRHGSEIVTICPGSRDISGPSAA